MTALWYSIGSVFYGCVLNLFVITSLNSQNTLNFICVCVWGGGDCEGWVASLLYPGFIIKQTILPERIVYSTLTYAL